VKFSRVFVQLHLVDFKRLSSTEVLTKNRFWLSTPQARTNHRKQFNVLIVFCPIPHARTHSLTHARSHHTSYVVHIRSGSQRLKWVQYRSEVVTVTSTQRSRVLSQVGVVETPPRKSFVKDCELLPTIKRQLKVRYFKSSTSWRYELQTLQLNIRPCLMLFCK
jgi:hypothetical protein